jgi:hypothetical protein
MGTSSFSGLTLDLSSLFGNPRDLSALVIPFSHQEINEVVKALPSDKSPRSNGFNIDFINKCSNIINEDFYNLCFSFYDGNICLQSINSSCITLILKKR